MLATERGALAPGHLVVPWLDRTDRWRVGRQRPGRLGRVEARRREPLLDPQLLADRPGEQGARPGVAGRRRRLHQQRSVGEHGDVHPVVAHQRPCPARRCCTVCASTSMAEPAAAADDRGRRVLRRTGDHRDPGGGVVRDQLRDDHHRGDRDGRQQQHHPERPPDRPLADLPGRDEDHRPVPPRTPRPAHDVRLDRSADGSAEHLREAEAFVAELLDRSGGAGRVEHHLGVAAAGQVEPDGVAGHLRHRDPGQGRRPRPTPAPATLTTRCGAGPRVSSSTVPLATSRPRSMIATSSHSPSTRSSWWLENSTVAPASRDLRELGRQHVDRDRIEPGERLVEHDDLGFVEERPGQLHPLLVAERQLLDLGRRPVGQAQPLEPLVGRRGRRARAQATDPSEVARADRARPWSGTARAPRGGSRTGS